MKSIYFLLAFLLFNISAAQEQVQTQDLENNPALYIQGGAVVVSAERPQIIPKRKLKPQITQKRRIAVLKKAIPHAANRAVSKMKAPVSKERVTSLPITDIAISGSKSVKNAVPPVEARQKNISYCREFFVLQNPIYPGSSSQISVHRFFYHGTFEGFFHTVRPPPRL